MAKPTIRFYGETVKADNPDGKAFLHGRIYYSTIPSKRSREITEKRREQDRKYDETLEEIKLASKKSIFHKAIGAIRLYLFRSLL